MKKRDLEKMLMDPQGVALLVGRANAIKQKYGEENGEPTSQIQQFVPEIGLTTVPGSSNARPTQLEIAANDHDYRLLTGVVPNVTLLIQDLKQANPRSSIKVLTEKFRKDSSGYSHTLLVSAINRLVSTCALDDKDQKLVEAAIRMLEAADKSSEKATYEKEVKE